MSTSPWLYPIHHYHHLLALADQEHSRVRTIAGDTGAALAAMVHWGLPVPPAFVITMHACRAFRENGDNAPSGLWGRVMVAVAELERLTESRLGDPARPLLLAIRPAYETDGLPPLLNIGLTERVAQGWRQQVGVPEKVDAYRQALRAAFGAMQAGVLPDDPYEQLRCAIEAAFRSAAHADKEVAVTVQAMVYGDHDAHSAQGTLSTRDVVTGLQPLETAPRLAALLDTFPALRADLYSHCRLLEQRLRDVQSIEVVVESGKLWFWNSELPTRTATVAVQQAVELASTGIITRNDAILSIPPAQLEECLATPDNPAFQTLLRWADEVRVLEIYADATTAEDARRARSVGAEGLGMVRPEHFFFAPDRFPYTRALRSGEPLESRQEALTHLGNCLRDDFLRLFRVMEGCPVIVRLMTATPQDSDATESDALSLGIHHPDVTDLQVRALLEAACAAQQEGILVRPTLLIPAVHGAALKQGRERVEQVAQEVFEAQGVTVTLAIGVVMDTPRATITADDMARYAERFAFDTDALTHAAFGLSGQPATDQTIVSVFPVNPFATLDQRGVGRLLEYAVAAGQRVRSDIELGIGGDHACDPDTIHFCYHVGMSYLTCAIERIPIARLAAAHAALTSPAPRLLVRPVR